MKPPSVNNVSRDLTEDIKYRRMRELFEMMDSDMDEFICADNIDIQCLTNTELDILTPVLLNMEESGKPWSFIDFA